MYYPSPTGYAMSKSLQIIINPSELGAGTRGASLGPSAIQAAARSLDNPLFSEVPWIVLPEYNHLLDRPVVYPLAKRIDGMQKVYQGVSDAIVECVKHGYFPMLIAGDHASAGGSLLGLKNAFPNQRIGVVWIDAHADLHSPYTTPSGNLHGMPLATALGVDNLSCQKNQVDIETSLQWNQLKSHSVKSEDLILVGVRSTEPEEEHIIQSENITVFTVPEIRQHGVKEVLDAISNQLKDCDLLYVSFDVDSMDPEETSYGTGTPVPGGITVREARELLSGLCAHPKLRALEFVEGNPVLDNKKNYMAEVALELITHCKNTLQEHGA
ncbi:MAG: arginase [Bacteroidota bacterium]